MICNLETHITNTMYYLCRIEAVIAKTLHIYSIHTETEIEIESSRAGPQSCRASE